MTEEVSQVYEDVDIKSWAQQIRKNKIRELQQLAAKAPCSEDAIKLFKKIDVLIKN